MLPHKGATDQCAVTAWSRLSSARRKPVPDLSRRDSTDAAAPPRERKTPCQVHQSMYLSAFDPFPLSSLRVPCVFPCGVPASSLPAGGLPWGRSVCAWRSTRAHTGMHHTPQHTRTGRSRRGRRGCMCVRVCDMPLLCGLVARWSPSACAPSFCCCRRRRHRAPADATTTRVSGTHHEQQEHTCGLHLLACMRARAASVLSAFCHAAHARPLLLRVCKRGL
jgi:hypothetical protein